MEKRTTYCIRFNKLDSGPGKHIIVLEAFSEEQCSKANAKIHNPESGCPIITAILLEVGRGCAKISVQTQPESSGFHSVDKESPDSNGECRGWRDDLAYVRLFARYHGPITARREGSRIRVRLVLLAWRLVPHSLHLALFVRPVTTAIIHCFHRPSPTMGMIVDIADISYLGRIRHGALLIGPRST